MRIPPFPCELIRFVFYLIVAAVIALTNRASFMTLPPSSIASCALRAGLAAKNDSHSPPFHEYGFVCRTGRVRARSSSIARLRGGGGPRRWCARLFVQRHDRISLAPMADTPVPMTGIILAVRRGPGEMVLAADRETQRRPAQPALDARRYDMRSGRHHRMARPSPS